MTSSARLHPDHRPAGRVPRAPEDGTGVLDQAFRTPVRGHAFAARPPEAAEVAAGRPARLVREPDNPRDPLAVAVWVDERVPWRVGYLDRAVAARLAPRLDGGQRWTATVDGWTRAPGGWRRPLLRVGRPRPRAAGLWGRPPAATRRVVR